MGYSPMSPGVPQMSVYLSISGSFGSFQTLSPLARPGRRILFAGQSTERRHSRGTHAPVDNDIGFLAQKDG